MYKVELTRNVERELERIYRSDRSLYDRFLQVLQAIGRDPLQGKPLHGKLRGLLSYRMGSYLILYEVHRHRLRVIVIDLGHRREIYR